MGDGRRGDLLSMVRSAGPEVEFAVLLPVPPAATQDAFGANYGSGQTRWQYRRNQHRLLECLLERYAGRESEHVHVIPTHLNLDCVHNYPAVTEPANLRSSVQLRRLNNGVHPAAEGYQQIGDSLYAWLKARGKSQSAAPRSSGVCCPSIVLGSDARAGVISAEPWVTTARHRQSRTCRRCQDLRFAPSVVDRH
jgi:hypothetical protein